MEISDFISQFLKLKEKEIEQKVWEFWLAKYPHMTEDTYVSYEEMLNMVKQKEVKQDVEINGVYIDQIFF